MKRIKGVERSGEERNQSTRRERGREGTSRRIWLLYYDLIGMMFSMLYEYGGLVEEFGWNGRFDSTKKRKEKREEEINDRTDFGW